MSDDVMILILIVGGCYALMLFILPFVVLSISGTAKRQEEELKKLVKLLEYQDKVMRQHDREGGE